MQALSLLHPSRIHSSWPSPAQSILVSSPTGLVTTCWLWEHSEPTTEQHCLTFRGYGGPYMGFEQQEKEERSGVLYHMSQHVAKETEVFLETR